MKRCLVCDTAFTGAQWLCPACGYAPRSVEGLTSFADGLCGAPDGFDATRYDVIADVERRHFWFRARNDLIVWAVTGYFHAARSLLEVGCGTGQVLGSIYSKRPGMLLVGTEVHLRGLQFARKRLPEAELLQSDARWIPYRNEFDVVCAFDVLEHIDDDAAVLAQMYRACRSGGGIVVTVPQHAWLWSRKDELAHHKRRYCRADLLAKVEQAGFRPLKCTSFVSFLLPLMYASRLMQRSPVKADLGRELRISPLLNGLCFALMRVEARAIRSGLSLPAGGSLLLVAAKS